MKIQFELRIFVRVSPVSYWITSIQGKEQVFVESVDFIHIPMI